MPTTLHQVRLEIPPATLQARLDELTRFLASLAQELDSQAGQAADASTWAADAVALAGQLRDLGAAVHVVEARMPTILEAGHPPLAPVRRVFHRS